MTQPWFRFYRSALHNPKVLRLSDKQHRAWVSLLCCTDDDGYLPPDADVALILRMAPKVAATLVEQLQEAGFFVADETGVRAHDWSEHQKRSDTSNERVKRYRQRTGNVTKPVTVTAPEADTDTETEAEKKPQPDRLARVMELFEANGADIRWADAPSTLRRWQDAGYDFDRHIWPVLSERVAKLKAQGKQIPQKLSYYEGAIADRHAEKPMPRASSAAVADPRAPESDAKALVRMKAHAAGQWIEAAWGPPPGHAGCLIPAHILERKDAA